jgi:serine/threonine protein kinase
MGIVYEAFDPRLSRRVALKTIDPRWGTEKLKQQFLREARAAAAMRHVNVVPIYHFGEDGGVLFIVMPLLVGESLEQCLRRTERLPVSEVIRIGRETAAGLAAAHAKGLVHRDIKPGNIWLEPEGPVQILDFGLAHPTGDDPAGALVGTPAYMSPEQAARKPVDARSDLFSLGCVLYQTATGHRPFVRATANETLAAVATHEPIPPDQLNADVPPGLSRIILRLLAKNPLERYQDAGELMRVLWMLMKDVQNQTRRGARAGTEANQKTVAGRESPPVPLSFWQRVASWFRRRKP